MLHVLLATATLVAAAACASSPASRFHTLVARQGVRHEGPRLRIQVRRPSLPRELDTNHIARRSAPTKLEFIGTERWGAPLEVVVGQTLVENLALRLPDALVYSEDGPIGVKPDVLVETEFQRFGLDENQRAKLAAHVAFRSLDPPSTDIERYSFGSGIEAGGIDAEIDALSRLLAQFSDAVVLRLLQLEPMSGGDTGECACEPRGDLPR